MIVKLSNGRKFIVKNKYTSEEFIKETKDEYGRDIFTIWQERGCIVNMYEYFKSQPTHRIIVQGRSHCAYQDKFDKKYAKIAAYIRAIEALQELNIINENEFNELATFSLNCSSYTCSTIEENA